MLLKIWWQTPPVTFWNSIKPFIRFMVQKSQKPAIFDFLEPGLKLSGFPCEIFCYQAQLVHHPPPFLSTINRWSTLLVEGWMDRLSSSTSTSHRMGKSQTFFHVHQLFFVEKTLQKCLKVELGFFDANFFSILNFVGALLWLASVWASNSKFWREEFSNADCECQAPLFQCRGVIPIWAQECSKFCSKISSWIPSEWNSIGVDIQFGGCHYIAPNDEEMLFRIFLAFLTSLLFPPPRWF